MGETLEPEEPTNYLGRVKANREMLDQLARSIQDVEYGEIRITMRAGHVAEISETRTFRPAK